MRPGGGSLVVHTADYHTAGEPFRIVSGGVPALAGETVLDRRAFARDHLDHVRAFLVNEPRGHADMYGCFVTPPDDAHGDLGAVFFHKDGFSTACGHGTIALAAWALETGLRPARAPVTPMRIDVPSGRLAVEVDVDGGGSVGEVRFENVPAWVAARAVPARWTGGDLAVDVAYGGAFYAAVDARALGLPAARHAVGELIRAGREIKASLAEHPALVHPREQRLSGLYGVIFFEALGWDGPVLHHRNVTVFADGEVDRSPCGSGTSARLALLHADGTLPAGRALRHEGVVGECFRARVVAETQADDHPAVITEIAGRAYRTGFHTFVLDPRDPLGLGFQLR